MNDILDNIDRIVAYTRGQSLQGFTRDHRTRDAVERCLLRISEAARKLEGVVEEMAPDQPWQDIRSLGNVIRHEYDSIDSVVIWKIIEDDLGPLRKAAEVAIKRLERAR